jgi:TRAP-type C4-dicarboxylate transport system permease small subunit
MDHFVKAVHKLAKFSDMLAWVAIVVMMVIVVFNCISRRLGLPVYGTYDYVGFLLVLVTAPALANCATEKGHIFLSMFTDKFTQKSQYITGLVIDFLSFTFCGILMWALFDRAFRRMESGITGMTSSIPVYPFIFLEALVVLLLCLVYLTDFLQIICKLRSVDKT